MTVNIKKTGKKLFNQVNLAQDQVKMTAQVEIQEETIRVDQTNLNNKEEDLIVLLVKWDKELMLTLQLCYEVLKTRFQNQLGIF